MKKITGLLLALGISGCDNFGEFSSSGYRDMQMIAPSKDLKSGSDSMDLDDILNLPDLGENLDLVSLPDFTIPCYTNSFLDNKDLFVQTGDWTVKNGELVQPTPRTDQYSIAYLDNATYKNFIAEVEMTSNGSNLGGGDYLGLVFRYNRKSPKGSFDPQQDVGYIAELDNGDGMKFNGTLEKIYDGRLASADVNGKYDQWHKLKVSAIGDQIDYSVDGKLVLSSKQQISSEGYIGFGSFSSTGKFKNLKVCPQ